MHALEARAEPLVPLISRGRVFTAHSLEVAGRGVGRGFTATDAARHIGQLILPSPALLADVQALSCEEVVQFMAALGKRLHLDENTYMQRAFELSCRTSALPRSVLRGLYLAMPGYFEPAALRPLLHCRSGGACFDQWSEQPRVAPADHRVRVRAFGARAVHIVAGNVPTLSALSIIRNALARSDAILKAPANDPLTAISIAQTMLEMEPDHPLTRHLSVAYWKGGDERVEAALYTPRSVEKIIAWGGLGSIRHIHRYLQPGIDLITFDPKYGCAIIGPEAFARSSALDDTARRLAWDIGALNQEACFSCRVVYAMCGTDAAGVAHANELGRRTFAELQRLPVHVSAPHPVMDSELSMEIEAARLMPGEYRVFGGAPDEGAIVVSQTAGAVDYARRLTGRVANIVPLADADGMLRMLDSSVQTVGVYPESLKLSLRDRLALQGVQRIVSLGGAAIETRIPVPQDGLEPLRRMCRWMVEEEEGCAA